MKPNKQQKINFINKCGAIFDEELLEASMLWYSKATLKKNRAVYLHGRYPAVSIYNEKFHIHRLIVMYLMEGKLVRGMSVHHKNSNVLDARAINLDVKPQSDHIRQHLKGKKQNPNHASKRTNASCNTRYGHNTIEYNSLHEGDNNEQG